MDFVRDVHTQTHTYPHKRADLIKLNQQTRGENKEERRWEKTGERRDQRKKEAKIVKIQITSPLTLASAKT